MGVLYNNGQGVEEDYSEAVKWFRKAAAQNNPQAKTELGRCYYLGKALEKDYAEALKLFREAAEQSDSKAQIFLGVCYSQGQGVEKDYAEAYAWLNLAATSDESAAKGRDALEKGMSAQQVTDAQKRTKELRSLIEAKLKSSSN